MLKKIFQYINTIHKMKPDQILSRFKRTLGMKNTLGVSPVSCKTKTEPFQSPDELDFDPDFLSRFDADAIVSGKVTFLYKTENIDWETKWKAVGQTTLWNFNLHYFEFLMPVVKAYKETGKQEYLDTIKACIGGWIRNNPRSNGGAAWEPYTISLRIVYWFSCLFNLSGTLDNPFKEQMTDSLHEQFIYLAEHLEKDILANHYFEDLKALILCSIAFNDIRVLDKTLYEFKKQCREQILADGMHFELSPMYHKLMTEAILRVAIALRSANKADEVIEKYIQPMMDVAYSFEEGLDRVPLFNDGGNNVAKSLNSLMQCATNHFGIYPNLKLCMGNSGYYIFKWNDWKMIVDAGMVGPRYNAGHAHCDAMSYELFYEGAPVVANCGTYAYQCEERSFFRSTVAHNTVMVENIEQSDCWSVFRMGKEGHIDRVDVEQRKISIQMRDQKKNLISRTITITDHELFIDDQADNNYLSSFIHLPSNDLSRIIVTKGNAELSHFLYAEEYGRYEQIDGYQIKGQNAVSYRIKL